MVLDNNWEGNPFMTLTVAMSLNALLGIALIVGFAYMLTRPRSLVPHVSSYAMPDIKARRLIVDLPSSDANVLDDRGTLQAA
jgi:hypothetical protein